MTHLIFAIFFSKSDRSSKFEHMLLLSLSQQVWEDRQRETHTLRAAAWRLPSKMLPVILTLLIAILPLVSSDSYDESLTIKPLNDGKVLAHFQFKTIWDKDMASVRGGELRQLSKITPV